VVGVLIGAPVDVEENVLALVEVGVLIGAPVDVAENVLALVEVVVVVAPMGVAKDVKVSALECVQVVQDVQEDAEGYVVQDVQVYAQVVEAVALLVGEIKEKNNFIF
jgi:hypothetical protein